MRAQEAACSGAALGTQPPTFSGSPDPEHRLVSAIVTELVQAGETTRQVYYAGLPKGGLQSDAMKGLRFPTPFKAVLDDVLNVRVPYTEADVARARKSLACHTLQFTPPSMDLISKLTEQVHGGQMHLRHVVKDALRPIAAECPCL